MSTMIIEVYDAFISAGADEQKARSAAQAINERDNELATIADIRSDIKGVRDEIQSLRRLMYFGFGSIGAGIVYLAILMHRIIDKL